MVGEKKEWRRKGGKKRKNVNCAAFLPHSTLLCGSYCTDLHHPGAYFNAIEGEASRFMRCIVALLQWEQNFNC